MRFLLTLTLLGISLFAQTPEEAAEKAYLANINTLLIFTSESGLSSGKYNFTEAGFKMDTYNLPFRHHYAPFEENLNLFISGGVGYSITRLDTQVQTQKSGSDIELTHDNKLQTYTAGLGGGVRYKSEWDIDFLAGAALIYSRVGTSINPQDEIGEVIKDFFDSEYNDNLTVKIFISAEYDKKTEGYRPYIKGDFKLYETKADFTLDELTSFTTQSDVTSLSLGVETPALLKYEEDYLSLEGYVKANYLHGDITSVVQFDKYLSLGALAYWYTPKAPSWARRFYTEISTIRAEGLEGYNIGIGFSIDY